MSGRCLFAPVQILTERRQDFGLSFQTKLDHGTDETVGKLLSLKDDRMNGSLPKIDEAGLLEEPGVNAIEKEFRLDGNVDNGPLLGRDLLRSAKVRDEFIPPLVERLTHTSSAI